MSEEDKVEGNLQVSKEDAAGFCMQIAELYVLPHFAHQLTEGKAKVEALQNPEEKFAEAKNVLATLVLNHHINLAVKALVEEREREAKKKEVDKKGDVDVPWED